MPSASALDRSGHHRRRRRRKSDSYDDEENALPSWKLWMVFAILIVCFAVLYPSLFHPMLVSLFSRGQQQTQNNAQRPPIHPAMNSPRASVGARPDVHPAMRMAPQAEAPTGSGKGMFTWMLPLYTVGVVVFLVYTLFKSKKKKKSRKMRYSSDDDFESESDEESEREGRMGKKQLHDLQSRLKETEMAMSKILEQINHVSNDEKVVTTLSKKEGAKAQAKEGYVNDLETALRQFKDLSDAYDKGEGMPSAARRQYSDESEEEDEEDEEEHSSSEEEIDDDEDELEEELEVEDEIDEPAKEEDSEAEIPEEPEPQAVVEPVPIKKQVRRRQRRT